MKPFSITISIFALAATLAAAPASAQQSNAGLPDLHVGAGYSNCFFDLHPELTQSQFDEFAGELGSILRFRQLADPATLGRGRVDVSLQYASASRRMAASPRARRWPSNDPTTSISIPRPCRMAWSMPAFRTAGARSSCRQRQRRRRWSATRSASARDSESEICPRHGVIVSSRTPTDVEPSGLV